MDTYKSNRARFNLMVIQLDQLNRSSQAGTDHAFFSDIVREKIRGLSRHQARHWRGAAWAMGVLAAIMFLSSFTLKEQHN